jgi:hypothetical protein
MLNPPVLSEIEHRLFVVEADVEIASRGEHLVAVGRRLRDDLPRRGDDAAAR